MTEKEIRQALKKAEEEFIDKVVDMFRRAITEAYMKGLMDGADLEHDDKAAEKRLIEEAEALASGQEPLPHINRNIENDCPRVRLKEGAQMDREIKDIDLVGCRNMRRIRNQLMAHNINTYGDLANLWAVDVMKWRGFGKKCFDELHDVMKMWDVEFRKS